MAGSITVSSITLDSDNNFSIKSNTGATLFFANTSGVDIANSIGATAITNDKILSVANTKISGNIISSQITSVANTQITGNITAAQITSVANTQLTGLIQAAQIGSANATLVTSGTLPGARLPAGSVLQVVQSNSATVYSTTSLSYQAATNHTVTITPTSTSSKILILHQGMVNSLVNQVWCWATIYRNAATNLYTGGAGDGAAGGIYVSGSPDYHSAMTFSVLDSPNTTSATTYTVYFRSSVNGSTVRYNADGWKHYMIAMEIAG